MENKYTYQIFTPDESGKIDVHPYTYYAGKMYGALHEEEDKGALQLINEMYDALGSSWAAIVVALDVSDEAVGYGSVTVDNDSAELSTSYVNPANRREGIYKELVRVREAIAKEQGAKTMSVYSLNNTQDPYLLRNGYVAEAPSQFRKDLHDEK